MRINVYILNSTWVLLARPVPGGRSGAGNFKSYVQRSFASTVSPAPFLRDGVTASPGTGTRHYRGVGSNGRPKTCAISYYRTRVIAVIAHKGPTWPPRSYAPNLVTTSPDPDGGPRPPPPPQQYRICCAYRTGCMFCGHVRFQSVQ